MKSEPENNHLIRHIHLGVIWRYVDGYWELLEKGSMPEFDQPIGYRLTANGYNVNSFYEHLDELDAFVCLTRNKITVE